MFPGGGPGPFTTFRGGGLDSEIGDGMNMRHDFQVIVGSFEEMQEILSKFRKVCESLTMPVEQKP